MGIVVPIKCYCYCLCLIVITSFIVGKMTCIWMAFVYKKIHELSGRIGVKMEQKSNFFENFIIKNVKILIFHTFFEQKRFFFQNNWRKKLIFH